MAMNQKLKSVLVVEQIIIYTAVVAATAFYYGGQHNANQRAHVDQIVKSAVQAATPPAEVKATPGK